MGGGEAEVEGDGVGDEAGPVAVGCGGRGAVGVCVGEDEEALAGDCAAFASVAGVTGFPFEGCEAGFI